MQNAKLEIEKENGRTGAPQKIQERAFEFACRIVRLHRALLRKDLTARKLANQLLDAGTSVGANLEEAEAGQSRPDFVSKCRISLKEARESLYWLRIFGRTEIVEPTQIDPLIQEAREIVAILTTIVRNSTCRAT
jgi:four helix bundle protein